MLYDPASNALRIADIHPLTPLQRGMLFSHVSGKDEAYIEQLSWTIKGDFDSERFKTAWNKAVARHGAMRSTVRWENVSQPYQVVHEKIEHTIQEQSGAPADWQELEAQERLLLPDLRENVPSRLLLVRLGEYRWRIIWTVHHILIDGWSVGIFLQDVEALYRDPCLELPPAAQFSAFAAWASNRPAFEEKADREYWQERLAIVEAPSKLVVHEADLPETMPAQYCEAAMILSAKESTTLEQAARLSGVTLAVALQAVTACLLSYYSGQKTVCFGSAVSLRPAEVEGISGMVGMFVSTLPSVVSLKEGQPIREWLLDIHRQETEGREHGNISLAELARLAGADDPQSFLDLLLVVENMPGRSGSNGDTRFCGCEVSGEKPAHNLRQPLSILVYPTTETSITFIYESARFSAAVIRDLMRRYKLLIERFSKLTETPGSTTGELHPLTDEERSIFSRCTLPEKPAEYIDAQSLLHAFELQAASRPDAPACTDGDGSFSYAQLNAEASRYARGFKAGGIGEGDCVALFLDKGRPMLAAILGLFKAGASYCPLDIDYPAARLASMIQASGSKIIVAGAEDSFSAPGKVLPPVISLKALLAGADDAVADHEATPAPKSIALTLFTSGTTGTPKGMCMTHQALLEGVSAYASETGLSADDTALCQSSPCFDMCAVEIFSAITTGAHLVLLPKSFTLPGEPLEEAVRRFAASSIFMTPSVLKTISPENVKGLKKLTVAGEKLPRDLARKWMPYLRFNEVYGPSEVPCFTTSHHLREGGATSSVGRPRYGNAVYVLNGHNRLLPPGAAGEICAASNGLVSGYINVPAELQKAFVPNPFWQEGLSPENWKIMYKTGDIGWYDPEGNLYYIGRRDTQLKINGVRIEAEEIEALLRGYTGIKDAAVVDFTLGPDTGSNRIKLLGACLISTRTLDENDIRAYLLKHLQNSAIPSVFISLHEFPLGGTGKLDRKALAEHLKNMARQNNGIAAPAEASEMEREMADLWQEVLKLPQVGREDHFFRLGGDSINVLQLVSLARKKGLDFHPEQLFRVPVLTHFVNELAKGAPKPGRQVLSKPSSSRREATLSQSQEWLAGLVQNHGDGPIWHIAAGLIIKGKLESGLLQEAFYQAAKRHPGFKTGAVRRAEGFKAVYSGDAPELRQADLRQAGGLETANRLAAAAWAEPLPLGSPPLLRGLLYRISDDEWAWGVIFHRLISDPQARGLLFHDTLTIYQALLAGVKAGLPPAPDYLDFVHEEPVLDDAASDREWAEMFIQPRMDLPAWNEDCRALRVMSRLPGHISTKVEATAKATGETPYIVLSIALLRALAKYTGRESLTFASPLNRRGPGTSGLAGPVSDEIHITMPTGLLNDPLKAIKTLAERRNLAVNMAELPIAARLAAHRPQDYVRPDGGAPIAISYIASESETSRENGLEMRQWNFPRFASQYEALVIFWQHGDKLELLLEHRLSFLPQENVEKFLDNFSRELEDLCDSSFAK